MGGRMTVWKGTYPELERLVAAIASNCQCPQKCPAHELLLEQRNIDGLIYVAHTVGRFMAAEFGEPRKERTQE